MSPKLRVVACVSLMILGACAEGLAPRPTLGSDVPDVIRTPSVKLSKSPSASTGQVPQSPTRPLPIGLAFDEVPDSATAVDNGWLALVTAYSSAWFTDAGAADGYGYTYYFGNYATMTLNLQLFRDATSIATATPKTTSRNPILPVPGDWEDYINIPSSITCGLSSTATAQSHAEVDALGAGGMAPISQANDAYSNNGYMNSCPEVEDSTVTDLGGGGGGGGGDEWETCYWLVYYDEYGDVVDWEDLGCYDDRAD